MAYGDFTLEQLQAEPFNIDVVETPHLFQEVPELAPSSWLAEYLRTNLEWLTTAATEKARSETMVSPVLVEIRSRFPDRCSVFSGIELNADAERGLRGYCDFILSRIPSHRIFKAPLLLVVEAKNGDLVSGFAQCIAGMLGARVFNNTHKQTTDTIYGAVTTGDHWLFMKLEGQTAHVDSRSYDLSETAKILGILKYIIGA